MRQNLHGSRLTLAPPLAEGKNGSGFNFAFSMKNYLRSAKSADEVKRTWAGA